MFRWQGCLRIREVDSLLRPVGGLSVVHNVVTNVGITHLLKILAGDDAANMPINRMQFGTGFAAALETDTALQMPVSPIKTLASVTAPSDFLVELTAYLLSGEANGFPLSEAGLLAVNGDLIARAVFDVRQKESGRQLSFTWQLSPKS